MNIIQYTDQKQKQRVGVVDGAEVLPLKKVRSTIELADLAMKNRASIAITAKALIDRGPMKMSDLLKGKRVLPPVTHEDPAHCIITGTGLTHLGSASARDSMHKKLEGEAEQLTDSLKMFKSGLEGGKPAKGKAGVQPEWFYKGDGRWLVAPGAPLPRPSFALDGGEEPELAGLYLDQPRWPACASRICTGQRIFGSHYGTAELFASGTFKLRHSAIGPEMVVGGIPASVEGMSRIVRKGKIVWEKPFLTGEANMSHTIANLEYHHFKYEAFRKPGDVHIHYFGTATLSIADGFRTEDGDIFEIESKPFGAPLRNPLKAMKQDFKPGGVKIL